MGSLRTLRRARVTTALARLSVAALLALCVLPASSTLSMGEPGMLLPGNAVHRNLPGAPSSRRPSVTDGIGLMASPAAMREEHLKTRVLAGSDRAGRAIGALHLESEHGLQLVDHRIATNLRPSAVLRL